MVKTNVIFHNEAIATGNGEEFSIKFNYSNDLTLALDITGTATSRTLVFQAKAQNGNWINVIGYNSTDASSAITTTSTDDEIWKFDLTGYTGFRVVISAIAGGNVTVIGTVVD